MHPWAVFGPKGDLRYIGLHSTEYDCWYIFLGWPDYEEIEREKKRGFKCERVEVRRH